MPRLFKDQGQFGDAQHEGFMLSADLLKYKLHR
jgi:hypothetical protein